MENYGIAFDVYRHAGLALDTALRLNEIVKNNELPKLKDVMEVLKKLDYNIVVRKGSIHVTRDRHGAILYNHKHYVE